MLFGGTGAREYSACGFGVNLLDVEASLAFDSGSDFRFARREIHTTKAISAVNARQPTTAAIAAIDPACKLMVSSVVSASTSDVIDVENNNETRDVDIFSDVIAPEVTVIGERIVKGSVVAAVVAVTVANIFVFVSGFELLVLEIDDDCAITTTVKVVDGVLVANSGGGLHPH